MANSYKGKIEAIESIQSINREGKEPFQKRRVMLDATRFDGLTGERGFEKHVIFEFTGKNATIPNDYKVGEFVEIAFDVESYKGRKKDGTEDWFTSIRGYKMSRLQPVASQGAFQPQPQVMPTQQVAAQPQPSQPVVQDNGLPF